MKNGFIFVALFLLYSFSPNLACALEKNTFSGAVFLGDSFAPNQYRISYRNFDVGASDIADLYVGSRKWFGNTYAGMGLGVVGSIYGMVGYEWRFIPWAALSFEFDGATTYRGETAGRGYIGIVVGW